MLAGRTMTADLLLSRLLRVKKTGKGTWLSCCPAHEDRNPSLAIRELEDGRILIYCHAQCSADEVVSAVGMTLSDLMPPRAIGEFKRERQPFNAHDVLMALETELTIATVTLLDISHRKVISDTDRQRALLASQRIRAAIDLGITR